MQQQTVAFEFSTPPPSLSLPDVAPLSVGNMKTQKALGLVWAGNYIPNVIHCLVYKAMDVAQNPHLAFYQASTHFTRIFARPCPVRPRHGFVDSRVVENPNDLCQLAMETIQADKDGEIIFCQYIEAEFSGIITPHRMVLGQSNDGATSGRKTTEVFINTKKFFSNEAIGEVLCKVITESPFIETVSAGRSLWTTQLRDGPGLPPGALNYIPKETKVTAVVAAKGTLLEWEEAVKGFKPGTVVYHKGGSLGSHYGVHCFTKKIPYLTDGPKPKVGDILTPDESSNNFELDLDKFREGLLVGLHTGIARENLGAAAAAAYLGLHHFSANTDAIGSKWIGASVGIVTRLLCVACLGEYRHYDPNNKFSREHVYSRYLEAKAQEIVSTMASAMDTFMNGPRGDSVGGMPWAEGCRVSFCLIGAIKDFLRAPSEAPVKFMIDILNLAVNLTHNGGWLLNKFSEEVTLQYAADGGFLGMYHGLSYTYRYLTSVHKGAADWDTIEIPEGKSVKAMSSLRLFKFVKVNIEDLKGYTPEGGVKVKVCSAGRMKPWSIARAFFPSEHIDPLLEAVRSGKLIDRDASTVTLIARRDYIKYTVTESTLAVVRRIPATAIQLRDETEMDL